MQLTSPQFGRSCGSVQKILLISSLRIFRVTRHDKIWCAPQVTDPPHGTDPSPPPLPPRCGRETTRPVRTAQSAYGARVSGPPVAEACRRSGRLESMLHVGSLDWHAWCRLEKPFVTLRPEDTEHRVWPPQRGYRLDPLDAALDNQNTYAKLRGTAIIKGTTWILPMCVARHRWQKRLATG